MARHPNRFQQRDYIGRQSYFLTFCCSDRKPRFADSAMAQMVIDQLLQTSAALSFAITAYCIMTDHVHVVVTARLDDCDLIKCSNGSKNQRRLKPSLSKFS